MLLIESQYLPPVAYFQLMAQSDTTIVEGAEHYSKGSYRNRCHIAGANGILRLSIPLESGKHQQKPIQEVRVSYQEPWHKQHWQSIQSAYGQSPYFDFYGEELKDILFEKKEKLFELNQALLAWACEALQFEAPTISTVFEKNPEGKEDYRNKVHPKKDSPVQLLPYTQIFEERHGFLENLSIVDLIFCKGPEASSVLLAV